AYTAARAGAVARLRLEDYYTDGTQWWFHFGEKGGKVHLVPARHDLQQQMGRYLRAAGLAGGPGKGPLFRSARGRVPRLSERGLTGNDPPRILQRRPQHPGPPG